MGGGDTFIITGFHWDIKINFLSMSFTLLVLFWYPFWAVFAQRILTLD